MGVRTPYTKGFNNLIGTKKNPRQPRVFYVLMGDTKLIV